MPTLHVVIPVYNEPDSLEPCVRRVIEVPLPDGWDRAIYLVDDHSDDPGREAAERVHALLEDRGARVTLKRHEVNCGKGAALQTGFDLVLGSEPDDLDLAVIQDADLEYDPADYPALMQPVIEGGADAVIGTRWGTHREIRGLKRRIHALGNATLTWLSNRMTGYRLSDMECCYKLFPVELVRRLRPRMTEPRFGVEPQLVAAMAAMKTRVVETPVRYDPRGIAAGKKIGWRDGVRALYVIVRERMRS